MLRHSLYYSKINPNMSKCILFKNDTCVFFCGIRKCYKIHLIAVGFSLIHKRHFQVRVHKCLLRMSKLDNKFYSFPSP